MKFAIKKMIAVMLALLLIFPAAGSIKVLAESSVYYADENVYIEVYEDDVYLYGEYPLEYPLTLLMLTPSSNWLNLPAAGGVQKTVNISTSAPRVFLRLPSWLDYNVFLGGFTLTAPRNTGPLRSGWVHVFSGDTSSSFFVSQLAGSADIRLTITPYSDWLDLPAAGGAQKTVNISTDAPYAQVLLPYFLDVHQFIGGFTLTAQRNTGPAREYMVYVRAGDAIVGFRVSQLAGYAQYI